MPIEFGRAPGTAAVAIDESACTVCGLCAKVCMGGPLTLETAGSRPRINIDLTRLFGCIACGQCMAVCPSGAITVSGRDMSPADALPMPESPARFDDLYDLMLARRSMRIFKPREVEPALVEQILRAASTAPMGLPPSEVSVLVLEGREKVKTLSTDLLASIKKVRPFISPLSLALMRPFVGREMADSFKSFVVPAVNAYLEQEQNGEDWFLYGAPLALYFYASTVSDPADPIISATYAMLAAESLGLGTCMLGFPGYVLKYHGALRARWGLPRKMQIGLMLVAGYPGVHYAHALRRRLAGVKRA